MRPIQYSTAIKFIPQNINDVPADRGTYQVGYKRDQFVVKYIGRARGSDTGTTIRSRYKSHVNGMGNDALSHYMNTRKSNHIWFRWHVTESGCDAANEEAEYSRTHIPPEYNSRMEYPHCHCTSRCATSTCPCRADGRNCTTLCHHCTNHDVWSRWRSYPIEGSNPSSLSSRSRRYSSSLNIQTKLTSALAQYPCNFADFFMIAVCQLWPWWRGNNNVCQLQRWRSV